MIFIKKIITLEIGSLTYYNGVKKDYPEQNKETKMRIQT